MVGQYKKVNEMTNCHAAFLSNMEQMIEGMAAAIGNVSWIFDQDSGK
jgi:hypothetical protein